MLSTGEYSKTREQISGGPFQRVARDILLADFRDEDLKEITEEDVMRQYAAKGKPKIDNGLRSSKEMMSYMGDGTSFNSSLNCSRKGICIERPRDIQESSITWLSKFAIDDPENVDYCYLSGKLKKQTHIAAFNFVPRHSDEVRLDIYDPLHISFQSFGLWFEGLNMRTGERGFFPSYYAQTVPSGVNNKSENQDERWNNFFLYLLGSTEVPRRMGSDILCQAMYKVAMARRQSAHSVPPTYVCLKVNMRGVKVIDQSELKRFKSTKSQSGNAFFYASHKVHQKTHFFHLKNVSFCGHHPGNEKYFGFITQHPTEFRFACHTFVCHRSTRPILDCLDATFTKSLQGFKAHTTDDIYLE